jgi:hypothetical protein
VRTLGIPAVGGVAATLLERLFMPLSGRAA